MVGDSLICKSFSECKVGIVFIVSLLYYFVTCSLLRYDPFTLLSSCDFSDSISVFDEICANWILWFTHFQSVIVLKDVRPTCTCSVFYFILNVKEFTLFFNHHLAKEFGWGMFLLKVLLPFSISTNKTLLHY